MQKDVFWNVKAPGDFMFTADQENLQFLLLMSVPHKRTHPLCCAFFSLEGGMDLNLEFKLPFNCFYCMKSGLLIHHYLIGKVVSQQ